MQTTFTAEQIKEAHSKVKSGADFPRYIQDLKTIGVLKYDHYLQPPKNVFYGQNDFTLTVDTFGPEVSIAEDSSKEKLQEALRIHQQGQTDFPTFSKQSAEAGVEKWISDLEAMSVTYVDKKGDVLVSEAIPTGNL